MHAARRLTSIEFSFDPCNIYRDGPRGVGYPADARSVVDSHPSCYFLNKSVKNIYRFIADICDIGMVEDNGVCRCCCNRTYVQVPLYKC